MLSFERQIVDRLVSTPDPRCRADITTFVEGALAAMPEHLRASIGVASVALGGWFRIARPARRPEGETASSTADPLVRALDTSFIPPIRQYVRLFRSLVLFAEQELV